MKLSRNSFCFLVPSQEYLLLLLRGLCPSQAITKSKKLKLLRKVQGQFRGDPQIAYQTKIYCLASLPDTQSKNNTWKEVSNTTVWAGLNIEIFKELLHGFSVDPSSISHLCQPFFSSLWQLYLQSVESGDTRLGDEGAIFSLYLETLLPAFTQSSDLCLYNFRQLKKFVETYWQDEGGVEGSGGWA